MTLTPGDLREFIGGPPPSDTAVQRLLDSAYAEIDQRLPPLTGGQLTEDIRAGAGPLLMLSHPATSIVSISEDIRGANLSLASSDYALRKSGALIDRLDTGANPRGAWYGLIRVVYVPQFDDADRDRVAIELIKLDVTHNPALASQSSDSWSESYFPASGVEYAAARESILASLGRSFVVL